MTLQHLAVIMVLFCYIEKWRKFGMGPVEFESEKLKSTLEKMEGIRVTLQKIPRYYGKDIVEQLLDDQRQQLLKNIQLAHDEPYFGRIDFEEDGGKSITPLY